MRTQFDGCVSDEKGFIMIRAGGKVETAGASLVVVMDGLRTAT